MKLFEKCKESVDRITNKFSSWLVGRVIKDLDLDDALLLVHIKALTAKYFLTWIFLIPCILVYHLESYVHGLIQRSQKKAK
jgi:hypothetical protein